MLPWQGPLPDWSDLAWGQCRGLIPVVNRINFELGIWIRVSSGFK